MSQPLALAVFFHSCTSKRLLTDQPMLWPATAPYCSRLVPVGYLLDAVCFLHRYLTLFFPTLQLILEASGSYDGVRKPTAL